MKCNGCGSEELETGKLRAHHASVKLFLDNTKFLTLAPNIGVQAHVCMGCGLVSLVADAGKANTVVSIKNRNKKKRK
jgi:hypothetical protein